MCEAQFMHRRCNSFSLANQLNSEIKMLSILLLCTLTFLNGWTDVPNSIATTVFTNALTMKKACFLSAICNLFGLVMSLFFGMPIAKTIFEIADLGKEPSASVSAVLLSVISISVLAWIFSMPSSESHSLVSSVAGVGFALTGKIDLAPFLKIVIYMILSCIFSLLVSYLAVRLLKNRTLPFKKFQIATCATNSFAHGAQDGQKLVCVMLFILGNGRRETLQAVLTVAIFLFIGTALGGGKITEMMGEGICTLNEKSGFASDICATLCLILCSIFGFPVSTSNIKACSILGAGMGDNAIMNYKSVMKIVFVAFATVPLSIVMGIIYLRILT